MINQTFLRSMTRSVLILSLLAADSCLPAAGTKTQPPAAIGDLEMPVDYSSAPKLSDKEVELLSYSLTAEFDRSETAAPAGSVESSRISRICAKACESEGKRYEILVYQKPALNVVSFPNGEIRIYAAMLDLMDDDELLFVIGRQIGHIKQGLSRRQLEVAYHRLGRSGSGVETLTLKDLADLKSGYLAAKFSQSAEEQADSFAVGFLTERRGSILPATTALQKLAALSDRQSANAAYANPEMRAKRLEAMAAGGQQQSPAAESAAGVAAAAEASRTDSILDPAEMEPIDFARELPAGRGVAVETPPADSAIAAPDRAPAVAPVRINYAEQAEQVEQVEQYEQAYQAPSTDFVPSTIIQREPKSATLRAAARRFEVPRASPAAAAPVSGGFSAEVPSGWYVQLAAEREEAPARERATALERFGRKAKLQRAEVGEEVYYRVLVGPFPDRATAERAKPELTDYGVSKGVPFVKEF